MPTHARISAPTHNSRFLQPYATLPLRAIVGGGLMQHGCAKVLNGPQAFVAILQALHIPLPHLAACLTVAVEMLGGLSFLLGAVVAWTSLPTIAILVTAMATVHLPYGFSSIKLKAVVDGRPRFGPPGYECDLLYLACIFALLCLGPGPWSFDGYRRRGGEAAGLAA